MVRFRPILLSTLTKPTIVKGSYQWDEYLEEVLAKAGETGDGQEQEQDQDSRCSAFAVPVESFFEAPFAEYAQFIVAGIKVEVALDDDECCSTTEDDSISLYWVASVVKRAGYRLLVRYAGMDEKGDEVNDVWISLASNQLRFVGFCADDKDSRFLIPPAKIANRHDDWPKYLLSQLYSYRTLPAKWPEIQHRKLNCCKFKRGDRLELLDSLMSSRVRPALVENIQSRRILVKVSAKDMNKTDLQPPPQTTNNNSASDSDDEVDVQLEEGIWIDQCSPLIFYVGWACKVGYKLQANDAYKKHASAIADAMKEGSSEIPYAKHDTRPEQFQNFIDNSKASETTNTNEFIEWEKGMKLEMLDPLDTWKELRVATVLDVLPDGYLKLGFDGEQMDSDCMPMHCASPLLFPAGYCEKYGLKLRGPQGDGKFDWKYYLKQSKSVAAPESLFDEFSESSIREKFKIGAKIEAVDMCESHLICAATVGDIKGRLLQIKYDGWDSSYDQLFDYRSNNIFPIGWCEMNSYKLEPPKIETKRKMKRKK